ncbi:MAG: TMEM165/GDT1 family protein, partial [Lentisphaerae bacterium]|nr:TMEM165/GDT1 family protein [Lentisphaerota bacterium]
MNWKLFASTFLLIFLAELGDKTQLAAMARAATGGSGKWIVFWAATLALALSTLIAVLFGGALTRVVPERAIKLAAGALFVVFGVIILVNAVRPGAEAAAAPKAQPGLLARAVLRAAAEFEA